MSSTINDTCISPLLKKIDQVLAAHIKTTGRPLDWRTAVRRVEAIDTVLGSDVPVREWEVCLGAFLVSESYTPESIRRVIAHKKIFGRVEGSPDIEESDVEVAEELVQYAGHHALNL
jgi:hypothetical protein